VRRLAALALAAALPGAAGAAPDPGPGRFAQGVAAGEPRATSALLWTRAPRAGPLRLEVAPEGRFADARVVGGRAAPAADRTVSVRVAGLEPGTAYAYRFRQGAAVSPVGRFRTAPPPRSGAGVRFAVSGDADATRGPDGRPAFGRFEVYERMVAERNDFNVVMGDTIYSDSGVAGARPALTLAAKRAKYREALALAAFRKLRAGAGLYSHWDDHELVNDFSRPEHGDALYRAGLRAFREYAPVAHRPRTGLFRHVRWGRHLELFLLDARSFRSRSAAQACGGDLAPGLPSRLRRALAPLAPSLGRPVSAACRRALASPARTMLGAAQLAAFERALRASTATFKVVLAEVPVLALGVLPYDRWEGYAAERARLLQTLRATPGAVVLATDAHAHLVGRLADRPLEAPPQGRDVWEVVTGPVATTTYGERLERLLGIPGAARLVSALFLSPAPPRGLGLRCAALDTRGYAQVEVTARALTVTSTDARGRPVRDAAGRACPPLVVPAP
jgi:alkaline phosphatase D